jgi:hypothetical protein
MQDAQELNTNGDGGGHKARITDTASATRYMNAAQIDYRTYNAQLQSKHQLAKS